MDIQRIIRSNADSWDAIAPDRHGAPPEFYREGGTALEPIEIELAGDVHGKQILQLACSTGDEVISWTLRGAVAHGIDISPVHIAKAQAKADAVGVICDLRVGDMFDLPADLTALDLIYISWGGICWAPDIELWARIVADALAPGGAVLISEHHPLWEVLSVKGENALAVREDYFQSGAVASTRDPAKAPVGGRGSDAPPLQPFVWSLGAVVTALLNAGLRIDALQEMPEPESYAGLGPAAAAIPAGYHIKATKPAGSANLGS
ncbi:MAG TPA: class I SAM-dependent methyltransferase [Mycobacteriales bacterium]|nr:class I SAM-dependent methyltransferase [Mycobacteriales bacterium]